MAKLKLPDKYSSSGYSDWGIKRTIREAENVARWNPWLAHAWMEEARDQLSLDRPFFEEFDAAVQRINTYWLRMRLYRWYNESSFWANTNGEGALTLLEPIVDREAYSLIDINYIP